MFKIILVSCILSVALCATLVFFGWELMLDQTGHKIVPNKQYVKYKTSHKRLEKARQHHTLKKQQIKKRFVKRASRRVLANSVAAFSLGTIGVLATSAGMEVYHYCSDMQALDEWESVLLETPVSASSFLSCLEIE